MAREISRGQITKEPPSLETELGLYSEAQENTEGFEIGQWSLRSEFKKSPRLVCRLLSSDWLEWGRVSWTEILVRGCGL